MKFDAVRHCSNMGRRGAFALLLCLVSGPLAALTVTPDSVLFNDQEQPVRLQIMQDGEPLPGDAVQQVQFRVDDHSYNHMIRIERLSDALLIHPTEFLEIGTYDLVITTQAGAVRVAVRSPLQDLATSLENRAAAQGTTVDALRAEYGLTRPLDREIVSLGVPEQYYVGQSVRLSLDGPADRQVIWRINGEIIAEGQGVYEVRYLFREPGDYILSMQETRDGHVISTSAAQVRVVPEPPVRRTVPLNASVRLAGPAGYDTYTWRLADQVIGNEQILTHTFAFPGEYDLSCIAEREGEDPALRRLSYRITAPMGDE